MILVVHHAHLHAAKFIDFWLYFKAMCPFSSHWECKWPKYCKLAIMLRLRTRYTAAEIRICVCAWPGSGLEPGWGGGAKSYLTSAMRYGWYQGGGDAELCNHDTTIMGKGRKGAELLKGYIDLVPCVISCRTVTKTCHAD